MEIALAAIAASIVLGCSFIGESLERIREHLNYMTYCMQHADIDGSAEAANGEQARDFSD